MLLGFVEFAVEKQLHSLIYFFSLVGEEVSGGPVVGVLLLEILILFYFILLIFLRCELYTKF